MFFLEVAKIKPPIILIPDNIIPRHKFIINESNTPLGKSAALRKLI